MSELSLELEGSRATAGTLTQSIRTMCAIHGIEVPLLPGDEPLLSAAGDTADTVLEQAAAEAAAQRQRAADAAAERDAAVAEAQRLRADATAAADAAAQLAQARDDAARLRDELDVRLLCPLLLAHPSAALPRYAVSSTPALLPLACAPVGHATAVLHRLLVQAQARASADGDEAGAAALAAAEERATAAEAAAAEAHRQQSVAAADAASAQREADAAHLALIHI